MKHKQGVILLLILACLAIAGMLLIAGLNLALSSHHVARQSGWSVQARWPAESGFERAAAEIGRRRKL